MDHIRSMDEIFESTRLVIMQLKKNKIKRQILTGLSLLLIFVITAGTVLAYKNANAGAEINEFGFGQAKISVIENEDYDWNSKEVKLAAATGNDYVPGVARLMLVPYIMNEGGTEYIRCDLEEMQPPSENIMIIGDITLELAEGWEDDWFYLNGFFYYNKILYPEAGKNETSVLLKKVSFSGDADSIALLKEKYDGNQIYVDVLASILQADGSAAESGSVLETQWDVKVSGDSVSPCP